MTKSAREHHPKFSVIIPAYNAGTTLRKCLEAIEGQTFDSFEVIVVDDCSTDDTCRIAESYGARLVRSPAKKGAGAARNQGTLQAGGDVLVFTDADCVPPPTWLERVDKQMEGKGVRVYASGYSKSMDDSFIGKFAHLELIDRRKNFSKYVQTSVSNNFACYREDFEKVGGFPEYMAGASLEDMVFSNRLSAQQKILWDPENGVGHHFKRTIYAYLRQQYVFGRDTVLTYSKYPELFMKKTHQGNRIHVEALLALGIIPLLFYSMKMALITLMAIIFLNLGLLSFLLREESLSFCLKSMVFIPIRDFVWIISLISGAVLALAHRLNL